ncbi:6-phosphogluconolactonase [Bacteroidia bacterium]|nr:6-phosphogluconolactonase [Bacteroidia bacterium]
MKSYTSLLLTALLFIPACQAKKESPDALINSSDDSMYLLVGSYSKGETPGISVYDFNLQNADFKPVSEVKNVQNPSYLAVSPDKKMVYSVNENSQGAVSSFRFDKSTGTLSFVNSQATEGADPCYINIDDKQNFLLTANYSDGNLSVFPLSDSGKILPLSQKIDFNDKNDRRASHAHTVVFSPDYASVFATDLGKDQITRFKINLTDINKLFLEKEVGTITLEKGSGPRHIDFHPIKKFAYCINELSGKVTVFQYDAGKLTPIQYIASDTTTVSEKKGSADIHVSPGGKFLYTSNRLQNDGIAIFSIDSNSGLLTTVGYQKTGIHPRNFIISPNGKYLLCANRDSNNIQIFSIDQQTGLLTGTGKEIQLRQPVCLKWVPK